MSDQTSEPRPDKDDATDVQEWSVSDDDSSDERTEVVTRETEEAVSTVPVVGTDDE